MKYRLKRFYGLGHLHFITCSRYRRRPLLASIHAPDLLLKILHDDYPLTSLVGGHTYREPISTTRHTGMGECKYLRNAFLVHVKFHVKQNNRASS